MKVLKTQISGNCLQVYCFCTAITRACSGSYVQISSANQSFVELTTATPTGPHTAQSKLSDVSGVSYNLFHDNSGTKEPVYSVNEW